MNKDDASKWIELASAMLQGKTIQLLSRGKWLDMANINTISYGPESYRIKPEPKKGWYSIARLSKIEYTEIDPMGDLIITNIESGEKFLEAHPDFIEWIAKRVEYTIEE